MRASQQLLPMHHHYAKIDSQYSRVKSQLRKYRPVRPTRASRTDESNRYGKLDPVRRTLGVGPEMINDQTTVTSPSLLGAKVEKRYIHEDLFEAQVRQAEEDSA